MRDDEDGNTAVVKMEVARRRGAKEVTKTTVAEDDEEDATIEDEAEDGIGSRDRSARSDTKLMWNADGRRGDRRGREAGLPGRWKLHVRGRRGGRRDHPREGWSALAAPFKGSFTRERGEF